MYEDKIAEAMRYSAMTDIVSSLMGLLVILFFIMCFVIIIINIINLIYPQSKRYRQTISDLYITAKIKQIADKENVDIDSELKLISKLDTRGKAFDKVLEERLNEKILVDLEEKEEKKKK